MSTLTAAQLERKRANDREAQRAIRQRTKDHIESLERRVAELTAQHESNADLMKVMERNRELEQENQMLRNRLNMMQLGVAENSGTYLHHSAISLRRFPVTKQTPYHVKAEFNQLLTALC